MKTDRSRWALFALLPLLYPAAANAQDNAWVSRGPTDIGYVSDVAITDSAAFAATENGIFRSSDGGATWLPSGLAGEPVRGIQAPPGAAVILASAYTRDFSTQIIYASRDGGTTWAPLSGLPAIMTIAIDPWHPATFYAGAADEPTIFKSTDSGTTWQPLPAVPVPGDRARGFVFDSLAIYVFSWNESESSYRYYRSADGGATWTVVRTPLSYVYPLAGGASSGVLYAHGTQGFCRSADSAATWTCANTSLPKFAYRILELPGKSPRILALGQERLFRSDDRGETWTDAVPELGSAYFSSLTSDASGSIALVATATGILRSEDGGNNWTFSNSGLRSSLVYSLAVDPQDPLTVWAETGFWGTSGPQLFRSSDSGFSWSPAAGPGGPIASRSFVVDPADSSRLFAGGYSVHRSDDGGTSWSGSAPFGRYVHTLTVDPRSDRVLAASSYGLHRSEDGGQTWISPPALAREVYSILFDGRSPGKVYAGSYFDIEPGWYGYPFGGSIFVSQDNGASFSKIEHDFGSAVSAIVADPNQDNALYAGTQANGVFRSEDGGAHWQRPAPQDTSIGNLISLVGDPVRPGRLYATTDLGVYVTNDGARTWQTFSKGLGPLRVGPLAITPDGRWLHVGTEGGGVFSLALASSYPCVASSTRLCLVEGRYAVTLRGWWEYMDDDVRPLGDRAGYFGTEWPDVVVKMLPAGAFGGRGAPFFYSSLTAAPFVLTVTDTLTGEEKTYGSNDDAPLCGGVDLPFDGSGGSTARSAASAESGQTALALLGGRFSVTLEASHRSGRLGNGVVMASDDRFGIFSLPDFTGDPSFPEVVVEMVDERAESGTFQVFYTGLTSLDYTLTVRDSVTGATRTYEGATAFCGDADIAAFTD